MKDYQRFFEKVNELIKQAQESEKNKIEEAAEISAKAIAQGGTLFMFGCGHAMIPAEEVYYRAGGLIPINPIFGPGITMSTRPLLYEADLERSVEYGKIVANLAKFGSKDVLYVMSNSGINPTPVEMALEGKRRGIPVVGLTSMNYSPSVEPKHHSGKRLYEVVDIVINNHSPRGDAILEIEGVPQKVGAVSNIVNCILLCSTMVQTISNLQQAGIEPPVFRSQNLPDGDEWNFKILEEYKDRLHYL